MLTLATEYLAALLFSFLSVTAMSSAEVNILLSPLFRPVSGKTVRVYVRPQR
jgi:hypothetical protein